MKAIAVVILVGFLTASAALMSEPTGLKLLGWNSYAVDITWQTDKPCQVDTVTEETTTCVNGKSGFCVGRTDFIIWRSNNPSNAKYDIYFDPIQGAPLKAGGSGRIVRQIDDNAPLAKYKYAIVRDGCTPDEANTFDPYIRVDH